MTELMSLQQRIRQALVQARRIRHDARTAKARTTRSTGPTTRASHRVSVARLARLMPEANPLTLAVTAIILASHGLLD